MHLGTQVLTRTLTHPKHFGPLKRGGGGLPGTPTYGYQNNPLVVLIILNTHMWGKKIVTPQGGPVPAAREVKGQKIVSCFSCTLEVP